jgi:thiamine phosphate phosphatase / amino-HMP aminohydrolase
MTMSMSSQRRAFILDFDGTITTKDTISILFNFALSTQALNGQDLTVVRDEILARYSEDYSKHVKDYCPMKEERKTLAREIEFYRCLAGVEARSFERVSNSGLFRGVSSREWELFGSHTVEKGEVIIRDGFGDFIERVKMSGGIWGVVSVNFSSHFIRGVLARAGVDTSTGEFLANHLDESGILLGPAIRENRTAMATSDAKLASMKAMLRSWESQGRDFPKVFYIGDSGTDIECLTEEGTIGIVIAEDRSSVLMETLDRVGVDVKQVDFYQDEQEARIFWARDFREILQNSSLMSQQIST